MPNVGAVPSPIPRQKLPTLTSTPTKRKLQELTYITKAKFQKISEANPKKSFSQYKSFTKLDGKLQLITTIELGLRTTTRARNFKKNPSNPKFRPSLEMTQCLTPRSKTLRRAKPQQTTPKLMIKLKKTEAAKPVRKQEEKEEEKEDRKEDSGISPHPSSSREVQRKAAPKPAEEQSTKFLVNYFEKLEKVQESSASQFQILGGNPSKPIKTAESKMKQPDWTHTKLRSGITTLEGEKQLRQED